MLVFLRIKEKKTTKLAISTVSQKKLASQTKNPLIDIYFMKYIINKPVIAVKARQTSQNVAKNARQTLVRERGKESIISISLFSKKRETKNDIKTISPNIATKRTEPAK